MVSCAKFHQIKDHKSQTLHHKKFETLLEIEVSQHRAGVTITLPNLLGFIT